MCLARSWWTVWVCVSFLSCTYISCGQSSIADQYTTYTTKRIDEQSKYTQDSERADNLTEAYRSTTTSSIGNDTGEDYLKECPSNVDCHKLGGRCIDCVFNNDCFYGQNITVPCTVKPKLQCRGDRSFNRTLVCQYCYQTPTWQQICTVNTVCRVTAAPPKPYRANCTVREEVLCLGRRTFHRMVPCNWISGYRWSTALALSITLGGFGVDRFYLGLWREGIGKLFSFGGLGVWTLLDVILIGTGYIGPADGSLYI